MPKVIEEIRSKYILQILFKYVPFKRMIKIIQYNKALISKLNYTKKEIKNFLFFKKIIKPVANCEDYLPIIKRILIPNDINSNNYIEKLFCTYLNNIKLFIPQINQINGNEIILNNLNSIKISYNHQFIENFYDTSKTLDFKKLFSFCEEYGEKIKEITFMDNNIPDKFEIKEVNYIMKYIITHSNIQKVEDRNTNNKFSFYDKSKFLELLEFKEDIINTKDYKITKKDKNVIDVIKEIKSYSLNFDERNSKRGGAIRCGQGELIYCNSPYWSKLIMFTSGLILYLLDGISRNRELSQIKREVKFTSLLPLFVCD